MVDSKENYKFDLGAKGLTVQDPLADLSLARFSQGLNPLTPRND